MMTKSMEVGKRFFGEKVFNTITGYLKKNPEELRQMIRESGAQPTHEGAGTILSGQIASKMDSIAEAWQQKAEKKWTEVNSESKSEKEEARV